MRRRLPPGPPPQDYELKEGPRDLDAGDVPVRTVRLSELFTATDRALIVYHMMFGKLQKGPCPTCTSFLDAMNGVAVHLEQKVDLAVVVAADPAAFRAHARNRGWNRLRVLSAGHSTPLIDGVAHRIPALQEILDAIWVKALVTLSA